MPKNKLLNFHALASYGFRILRGHYFSITGEENLSEAVNRTLKTTDGFSYRCLAAERDEDIQQIVLGTRDKVIPVKQVRSWHGDLIKWVVDASEDFYRATHPAAAK